MGMKNRGWTWLTNSTKWHYFNRDNKSMCGKFMLLRLPELEDGNNDSPDNCKACRKALEQFNLSEQATASAIG